MSYSQNDRDMDDQPPSGWGSIRRARERAEAGGPREDFATFSRRMAQRRQEQTQPPQQLPQPLQPPPPTQRFPMPPSARPAAGGAPPASSRIPIATRDGPIGAAISRPTPAAQWPLAGPLGAPVSVDAEPYHPPPGRSQPPQRPPRPSHVPSMLDSSKAHEPTPTVFQYSVAGGSDSSSSESLSSNGAAEPARSTGSGGSGQSGRSAGSADRANIERESDTSLARQSTTSSASRPSTVSSVGSIPDFPVPMAVPDPTPPPPPMPPMPTQRRSVNLGPPPSSRRGASSFYSNASYVSPIPEESPRSRSHGSFASSAAMPESWGSTSSMAMSPDYAEGTFYDDIIPEEGDHAMATDRYGDEGIRRSGSGSGDSDDESRLVRSASIGKRAKAALVTTTGVARSERGDIASFSTAGPAPTFREGTGYIESNTSSVYTAAPPNLATVGSALTADNMRKAIDAASATDASNRNSISNPNRRLSVSPQPPSFNLNANSATAGELSRPPYSRLSAIRRPPRLDIDAVRKAEARGSLTSLPDLIRRATRLAASLERGRRPASRFDNFDLSPGMYGRDSDRDLADGEKHQSGLSDMLAAFPPPAQASRHSFRHSFREQVSSWPLPLGLNNERSGGGGPANRRGGDADNSSANTDIKGQQRKRRRCCGLPLWGFVLLVIVILILVAAAIVIPLEFLVIKKQTNASKTALAQCQSQLTCENGGTNVVSSQGYCSCICTNGFTGFDCSVEDNDGCTTMSLTSSTGNSTLSNVTLGEALPRLIEQAQQNFSIELSGTQILAALNAANLSCVAENALVTFDGESVRQADASTAVSALAADTGNNDAVSVADGVAVVTATVVERRAAAAETLVVDQSSDVGTTLLTAAATAASGTTTSSQTTSAAVIPSSTTTITVTVHRSTLTTSGTTDATQSSQTTQTTGSSTTATTGTASSTATFTVTEDVLDFARVAVLYILQEQSLANAETAQTRLQTFFSSDGTESDALNLTLSNNNSVDLVNLAVTAPSSGNSTSTSSASASSASSTSSARRRR